MMRNLLFGGILATVMAFSAGAQEFNRIPSRWKWLSDDVVTFTYDGTYTDEQSFAVRAKDCKSMGRIPAPERYSDFPAHPEGAVNLPFSPDSSMLAFTRSNDLYVYDIASGKERRLTNDGSELILNGYASWVYYEEIFGRPSRYRAFWWSPDSKKIGFYRFDNTAVPMFPIYSAAGQDGTLRNTRYPKAGEPNPEVKIGIIDLNKEGIVWADFDEKEDQYFGTPFWGADSQEFFIAREPRIQNTLDLYSFSATDGSKKHIYHEEYKTWLDWINGMLFTDKGLYMARSFETGWQQIYFLSYDGQLRRLTDGPNWRISLLRADARALDALADDALRTADELDVGDVVTLPDAVRTRVLKNWAEANGSAPLAAAHVTALDKLVGDHRGRGPVALPSAETPGHPGSRLVAHRKGGTLAVSRGFTAPPRSRSEPRSDPK